MVQSIGGVEKVQSLLGSQQHRNRNAKYTDMHFHNASISGDKLIISLPHRMSHQHRNTDTTFLPETATESYFRHQNAAFGFASKSSTTKETPI